MSRRWSVARTPAKHRLPGLRRRAGRRPGTATRNSRAARLRTMPGEPQRAEGLLSDALAVFDAAGWSRASTVARIRLGQVLSHRGRATRPSRSCVGRSTPVERPRACTRCSTSACSTRARPCTKRKDERRAPLLASMPGIARSRGRPGARCVDAPRDLGGARTARVQPLRRRVAIDGHRSRRDARQTRGTGRRRQATITT